MAKRKRACNSNRRAIATAIDEVVGEDIVMGTEAEEENEEEETEYAADYENEVIDILDMEDKEEEEEEEDGEDDEIEVDDEDEGVEETLLCETESGDEMVVSATEKHSRGLPKATREFAMKLTRLPMVTNYQGSKHFEYFVSVPNHHRDLKNYAFCKLCTKIVYTGESPSGKMKGHLKSKHKTEFSNALQSGTLLGWAKTTPVSPTSNTKSVTPLASPSNSPAPKVQGTLDNVSL